VIIKKHLIIPGASRSGTTFIYDLLKQHPQIFAPQKKELRFFDKDSEYNKGIVHYFDYYKEAEDNQLLLDISPPYFHSGITVSQDKKHQFNNLDDSAKRIHKLIGNNAQILILLRNPVNRLYSQYSKNFFQEKENETLENAIEIELNGIRTNQNSVYCWIYKNNYLLHIQKWLTYFGDTKFILFEELIKNPNKVLNPVLNSIGLDDHNFITQAAKKNEGNRYFKKWRNNNPLKYLFSKYPSKITENQKSLLSDLLLKDIDKLEELTQLDLGIWKV
jgi:hypothetical protein